MLWNKQRNQYLIFFFCLNVNLFMGQQTKHDCLVLSTTAYTYLHSLPACQFFPACVCLSIYLSICLCECPSVTTCRYGAVLARCSSLHIPPKQEDSRRMAQLDKTLIMKNEWWVCVCVTNPYDGTTPFPSRPPHILGHSRYYSWSWRGGC